MKKALLFSLLAANLSNLTVFAMEEENSTYYQQLETEQPEAGMVQAYPEILSNPCSSNPTLSDFSDANNSYLISPICVQKACQGTGNIFFKNNRCFQITNMHENCSFLLNYNPSETLLSCYPFSKHPLNPQHEGWFCADMINNGEDLNKNNIPIYFEIRDISSNANSRPREDEGVIFHEMEQGTRKKIRNESNEMDVI